MSIVQQINEAIRRGESVYAIHSDVRRAGQPQPGQEVRITQAFGETNDGRIRVNASGYKGRFAVMNVQFPSMVDSTPDTY